MTFPISDPTQRERLLRSAVAVYAEGAPNPGPGTPLDTAASVFAGGLSEEDEELVAMVRATLAEIVVAVSGSPPAPQDSTALALDGSEMVLRMELLAGVRDGLPRLLPGFAYLVTLPHLGEPEAARLSDQVQALVDAYENEE